MNPEPDNQFESTRAAAPARTSSNPYEVSNASLTVTPPKTNRLYSPGQATMAAFFGGPLAAIYVVRSNYRELGNDAAFRAALPWGLVFVAVVLLALPFLPEKFPNSALPLAYALAVRQIVTNHQMTKDAIERSETYEFQSNWRVAGIAAITVVLFFAIVVAWMLLLEQFGFATI